MCFAICQGFRVFLFLKYNVFVKNLNFLRILNGVTQDFRPTVSELTISTPLFLAAEPFFSKLIKPFLLYFAWMFLAGNKGFKPFKFLPQD